MENLLHKLKLGSSIAAIIASAQFVAAAAQAQTAAPSDSSAAIETVVVTGTSIRGVQPVGSNLISVSAEQISQQGAQTVQEVLADMPALSNFGNAGEGTFHVAGYGPAIHNLGGSASSATLVIFDGHRAPNFGGGHLTVDPNIIPTDMVERVEVIPNGNSSIYGSDAVSGVINFVTRTRYDGLQLSVNSQLVGGASNEGGSMLLGKSWDSGSVIFSYQFVNQGKLLYKDRPDLPFDQTQLAIADGLPVSTSSSATNFKTFTGCTDALIRVNGTGNYYDAVTGQQYPTTTANAPCDPAGETTITGHTQRNNAMMKMRQDLSSDLTFGADILYSTIESDNISSVGTLGPVTVFATGPQANPYFQVPTGYTGAAPTTETVSVNLDNILGGPGIYSVAYTTNAYINATLEYKVPGSDWAVDWLTLVGQNQTHTYTNGDASPGTGTANSSAIDLALNGTTNTSGSTTTVSIPNTTIISTKLPITTATALDVWQVGAANRTTAAAKLAILNNQTLSQGAVSTIQHRLSANGTLFDLPAGPLKAAFGAEADSLYQQSASTSSDNTGATIYGSNFQNLKYKRSMESAFIELDAPVISPEMAIPFMQKLNVNISARYDHYSDAGDTRNPKYAFDWTVNDQLKLRGNYSTSFVAPTLDEQQSRSGTVALNTQPDGLPLSVAAYPILTQFAPSQFANGQACTLASGTCALASTVQGLEVNSGNPNNKPERGRGWEVGADYSPDFLEGLTLHLTYWNTDFLGGITGPNIGNVVNNVGLQNQLVLYPNPGLAASAVSGLTAPNRLTTALPTTISYIWQSINSNWLYIYLTGLDLEANYTLPTDSWGTFGFNLAGTNFFKFDEAYGAGGAVYSVLNTTGANTAFPSVSTSARATLSWSMGDFTSSLAANYVGPYRNWSGVSVIPITIVNGNPAGGGDPVKANITFDLHLSYDFDTGYTGHDEITFGAKNIFNTPPPFYLSSGSSSSSIAYDSWVASPLGRVFQMSLTAKF